MKRIGIIAAMDVELNLLKNKLNVIETVKQGAFEYHFCKVNDIEVILTVCGVGKVNASCRTQSLIDKFEVTHIINTGIAGSMRNDIKICDIVVSTDVTYHDVNKKQMKNCYPFMESFEACEELRNLAMSSYEIIKVESDVKSNMHSGRIVTGEYFVSNEEQKSKIIDAFDPHCVEMEGGAIGHVAHMNNIPFVVIRSISDNADGDATESYENFEAIAADLSARVVVKMVEGISV